LGINLNKQKKKEFHELLSQLEMGLENRMIDNVGQLSGGQRQALTMLMMVLSSPDPILLDEHTADLDTRNTEKALELTGRFYGNFNMKMALVFGNRLIMMDRGEIILETEGDEKSRLTVDELVKRFHDIRGMSLTNDKTLLS